MEQENVRDWTVLLGGRRRLDLGDGLTLRLLSAMEVLEARREALALMGPYLAPSGFHFRGVPG